MPNLKTILITGANRGIGLELVKESVVKGFSVIATYRNKVKSQELFQIRSSYIKTFEMDVIEEKSILKVCDNQHTLQFLLLF